jgi:hypothetical protein
MERDRVEYSLDIATANMPHATFRGRSREAFKLKLFAMNACLPFWGGGQISTVRSQLCMRNDARTSRISSIHSQKRQVWSPKLCERGHTAR